MILRLSSKIGKLYEPIKELGENINLDLELYNSEGSKVNTLSTPHSLEDGLSFFCKANNDFFKLALTPPLGNSQSKKSSLFETFANILKAIFRNDTKISNSKIPNSQPSDSIRVQDMLPCKEHFDQHIKFDKELVTKIDSYCQQHRISQNSLLTFLVMSSYAQVLNLKESRWMIPVNTRYKPSHQNIPSLYSSYFLLKLGSEQTPQGLHLDIVRNLKSGIHWANFYLATVLSALPPSVLRYLTLNDFKNSKANLSGSFTYLGKWDFNNKSFDDYYWVMFPTVRCQRPFGVVAIQWQNTITLGLRLHGSMDKGPEIMSQLISRINSKLEEILK